MKFVYIPYLNQEPAMVEVNGHHLVFVGTVKEDMEDSLEALGADSVECVSIDDADLEDEEGALIEHLADTIKGSMGGLRGGVVLTPPGIHVSSVIDELKQELPWLH